MINKVVMAGGDIYGQHDQHRVNNIIREVIKFVGRKFLEIFMNIMLSIFLHAYVTENNFLCLFIEEETLGNNVAEMV